MKKIKSLLLVALFIFISPLVCCDENGDLLLFSLEDDRQLGLQVAEQIAADPTQFPVLSRTAYASAYAILDGMLTDILASDKVTYKDEFAWELHIIDDDQTLNAFATPGGYIYIYTGLIYFLDTEDDLAGVLGHEVAHSDQRHGSKQLQRTYGISVLLELIAGGQSDLTQQILQSIVGVGALQFSKDAERDADDFSVDYLADTEYACNGAASFFEKLIANRETRNPAFLSTHPDPSNRVADINSRAAEMNCNTQRLDADGSRLAALQALLP